MLTRSSVLRAVRGAVVGLMLSAPSAAQTPLATAAADAPSGILKFKITDPRGKPLAARLTLLGEKGPSAKLFPNTQVAPNELAIRNNVIYALTGEALVTVPVGSYKAYASRGMEWSIVEQPIEIRAGETAEFNAELWHEVDTAGWISGDFHLHTLTHSGHGDANMKERVISFIGEGLEFAVATDHNHNIDYEPTLRELGQQGQVTTVVGNEVSTPVGHFNAFPLDPERAVPPPMSYNANQLFKLIREEPNKFGVRPVIQLNHPRWGNIDYFGRARLDPVTGLPRSEDYSADFDTIEVMNENVGWGYEDADLPQTFSVGDAKYSVTRDWFNLLNRGQRYTAVGNSDSHNVHSALPAWPRNFVRSPTDDPAAIQPADVATALRHQQSFASTGPFVEYWANGEPMGAQIAAMFGKVTLSIKVQAASWIDCDRVKIVLNGDVIETIAVPQSRDVRRFATKRELAIARDTWLTVLVEGDDSLAPIVHDQTRPARPIAIANPVWIDADGDGTITSVAEQAQALLRRKPDALPPASFHDWRPAERAMLIYAAAERKHPSAAGMARAALADEQRCVRLAAARACEQLKDAALLADLEGTLASATGDPAFQVALLHAMAASAPQGSVDRVLAFVDAAGAKVVSRYRDEIEALLPGEYVREWRVAGYFPLTSARDAASPETSDDLSVEYAGKDGAKVAWKPLKAGRSGYLDLRAINPEKKAGENAAAYAQCFIQSPDERTIRMAVGCDDGCRIWVNGAVVHEDAGPHAAVPLQAICRATLRAGWNRVLVKVTNVGGAYGLYLRVLDATVQLAPEKTAAKPG